MDAVSYSLASKQAQRIEKFIENPDSTSGIVTVPKTIASGETITIPAGRVAVLPNLVVDGVINIEGEVFVPSGSTYGDLDTQIALKAPLNSPALTGTPTAPTQTAGDSSTKIATTAFVLENQQNAPNYNVAVSRLYNTVYQATNSCLLVVKFHGIYMNGISVLVGSTSNPTTEIAIAGDDINSNTKWGTFHIPIKAGVYFKVVQNGAHAFESITITTYDYV